MEDPHVVVVKELFDTPLVHRKTYIEKPHGQVQNEVFQICDKLRQFVTANSSEIRIIAQVAAFDFPQFSDKTLLKTNQTIPQIVDK